MDAKIETEFLSTPELNNIQHVELLTFIHLAIRLKSGSGFIILNKQKDSVSDFINR